MMKLRGQRVTRIKVISETDEKVFTERVMQEIKNVNIVDYQFSVISSEKGLVYNVLMFVGETRSKT